MNIGDAIAISRRKKRIDQKQLAEDVGISPSYLSLVENNLKSPSPKLLSQIAEKLGLSVSTLIFESLKESDFQEYEHVELFKKAKPLLDRMIAVLLAKDLEKC